MASDHILLDAVSSNQSSAVKRCASLAAVWVEGTLAGDVITLEAARPDGATGLTTGVYVPIATITTKGVTVIYIPGVYFLRATLSASTGAVITVATN